jgi:hypothetical protein
MSTKFGYDMTLKRLNKIVTTNINVFLNDLCINENNMLQNQAGWDIFGQPLFPVNITIIFWFTSRLRIFHLYGDVTITGKGLQKLGLCLALRAFEQGGIFILPQLL